MPLSNKAKQQILRQRMHAMFPYLIKIHFDSLGDFYYANTDEDLLYNEKLYTACTFSVKPPDKTESKIGDGSISFSSIYNNSEWIKKIRKIPRKEQGSVDIVASIIYSADEVIDGIEPIYDSEFVITDVNWDDKDSISITLKFDDGMDIVMPCDIMDEIICPGIV